VLKALQIYVLCSGSSLSIVKLAILGFIACITGIFLVFQNKKEQLNTIKIKRLKHIGLFDKIRSNSKLFKGCHKVQSVCIQPDKIDKDYIFPYEKSKEKVYFRL